MKDEASVKHILLDDLGSVELVDELPAEHRATMLAVLAEYWRTYHVYREDGTKLRMSVDASGFAPPSLWRRLLAQTIYNPARPVPVAYDAVGEYSISEIKEKIVSCLPRDDDIITQFLDAAEIRRLLDRADSFEELAEAVRAIQGQHEADSVLEAKLRSMGILTDDEE
jgi:hypothetical protein